MIKKTREKRTNVGATKLKVVGKAEADAIKDWFNQGKDMKQIEDLVSRNLLLKITGDEKYAKAGQKLQVKADKLSELLFNN